MIADKSAGCAGFTLIEALVAMALMGFVVTALATISSQWLPRWNYGMQRVQRDEFVALGIDRLSADLAAAVSITPGRHTRQPLFEGFNSSVTFVRPSVDSTADLRLTTVRISEENASDNGYRVIRMQAPFRPLNILSRDPIDFADPVVLLKAPYRLSFSYAGRDRQWLETWIAATNLPEAIRLTIRRIGTEQTFSTVVAVHSNVSVECLMSRSFAECLAAQSQPLPANEIGPRS